MDRNALISFLASSSRCSAAARPSFAHLHSVRISANCFASSVLVDWLSPESWISLACSSLISVSFCAITSFRSFRRLLSCCASDELGDVDEKVWVNELLSAAEVQAGCGSSLHVLPSAVQLILQRLDLVPKFPFNVPRRTVVRLVLLLPLPQLDHFALQSRVVLLQRREVLRLP